MTMKTKLITAAVIMASIAALASCSDENRQAQELLQQAQENFEKGDFQRTLTLIDSLRHTFPKAIEERKKALALFQDASEKLAQKQIELTDMAIQKTQQELEALREQVASHKQQMNVSREELEAVKFKEIRLDSLKARFDAQCATVKIIRERRKAKN